MYIPALPSRAGQHSEKNGGNSFETKGTGMKGPSPGNCAHARAWPLGTLPPQRDAEQGLHIHSQSSLLPQPSSRDVQRQSLSSVEEADSDTGHNV